MSETTVPWYITFGFGGPWSGYYTEIRVPADTDRAEQQMTARRIAFAKYRKEWAFEYPPERFQLGIAQYGMKLREVVIA